MKTCKVCGIEFDNVRETARYCSPACRVTASRKDSIVTPNVTLSEPPVTLSFKFTVTRNEFNKHDNPVREATHWYDVPLAAIPVLEKGWPVVPTFADGVKMNGRQYFLWMKNNFETRKDGSPIILNPYPKYDSVVYQKAGEGSRRWGA